MSAAIFDQTVVDVAAGDYGFRATGTIMRFPGFTRVYEDGKEDEKNRVRLPELTENETLECRKLEPKQHFTEPPPRFTEAALVKALEDNGIGRPSTYSTIVETIQARGYVTQQERRFMPTPIGIAVNDLLVEHFPKIVNLDFTAQMEGDLDRIAEGHEDWIGLLRRFYGPFESELEEAEKKLPRLELRDEPTDEICPTCGRPMVIKHGRFGKFISCSGYPECKTTKPIVKETGASCPKCDGAIVERRSKKGRVFYGCSNYPKCDFISWDAVVPERCPVCGSHVLAKNRRGGNVQLQCAADRTHDVTRIAASG
jgi:DNA topoisomerase-1